MMDRVRTLDRYPTLVHYARRQATLSIAEAIDAVDAVREGDHSGGGEAVQHYGGAAAVVRDVWRNRHELRRQSRRTWAWMR